MRERIEMKIIWTFIGYTPQTLVILSMILGTIFDSICLFFSIFLLAVLIDHIILTLFPELYYDDYKNDKEDKEDKEDKDSDSK